MKSEARRRGPAPGASRPGTGTYVYCVVQRATAPRTSAAPRGLAGTGALRIVQAGGPLWLVAADAPLSRYGGALIDRRLRDLAWVSACALAHERVVEHFGRAGCVVPMKLFTIFDSDERALAEIARTRRTLDRVIARISGRQEWAVRLTLDESRVLRHARRDARRPAARAGTLFLLRKKGERDARREISVRSRATADAIFEALARHADDVRRRTPIQADGGPRLLLDAAFLVRSPWAARFAAAVTARARRLTDGYRLTLTGPWPPYNFIA